MVERAKITEELQQQYQALAQRDIESVQNPVRGYDPYWQSVTAEANKVTLDIEKKTKETLEAGGLAATDIRSGAFIRSQPLSNMFLGIGNAVEYLATEADDNFNPIANIPKGYELYANNFLDARSAREVDNIKKKIDFERSVDVYRNESPIASAALEVTGALTDPTNLFLPGGAAIKAAGKVDDVRAAYALTAAVGGGVATLQAGATEVALRSMQETRTEDEMYQTMKYSAAIGAIVGPLSYGLGRGATKASRAAAGVEQEITPLHPVEMDIVRNIAKEEIKDPFFDTPVTMRQLGDDIPFVVDDVRPAIVSTADSIVATGDKELSILAEGVESVRPVIDDLENAINAGAIPRRFSITQNINDAISAVSRARASGMPVAQLAGSMPELDDAVTKALVRIFHTDDTLRTIAKAEDIADRLRSFTAKSAKSLGNDGLDSGYMHTDALQEVLRESGSRLKVGNLKMTDEAVVRSDLQMLAKMEPQTSGGGTTGSRAVADTDISKLYREKRVRVLNKLNGGMFKKLVNEGMGLALSESHQARIAGAKLLDTGLMYSDPDFMRAGGIPAAIKKERDVIATNQQIDAVHRVALEDFYKEAQQLGITGNLKEVYNYELYMAMVSSRGTSFSSIEKAAAKLGAVRKQLTDKLVNAGLLDTDSVKFADEYLPRRYNAAKIRSDEVGFSRFLVSEFKQALGDENNPYNDMMMEAISEFEKRAEKQVQQLYGIEYPDEIEKFVKEDFDDFLLRVADRARQNIMDPKVNDGNLTYRSAFQNMKMDRTLAIRDETLINQEWIVTDPIASLVTLNRRVHAEVTLKEQFGTVDVNEAFKPIEKDINQMLRDGRLGKRSADDVLKEAKAYLQIGWSKHLDTFGYLANPATNSNLGASILRIWTPIVDAQLLDIAPVRNSYELVYAAREAPLTTFKHLIKSVPTLFSDARKLKKAELKSLQLGTEFQLSALSYQDPGTVAATGKYLGKAEAMAGNAATFYRRWVDFTYGFQDFIDNLTGSVMQEEIINRTAKMVSGKATAKDRSFLAHIGIDGEMSARIAEQLKRHGEDVGGYKFDHNQKWADIEAKNVYRDALFFASRRVKVSPKYDTPGALQNSLATVMVMKYAGAVMSAFQRSMIAAAQHSWGRAAGMVLTMTSIGALVSMLRDGVDGKEMDEPENYVMRGMLQGGAAGLSGDMATRLINTGNSFTGDASIVEGFGGAYLSSGDRYANIAAAVGKAATGKKPSSKQIYDAVGAAPGRRLLYMRPFYNEIENSMRDMFGKRPRTAEPFSGRAKRPKEK